MLINRHYAIPQLLESKKILVIFGPRRVGKTTLVQQYLSTLDRSGFRFLDGGDIFVQSVLSSKDLNLLQQSYGDGKVFVLDEAQKIPFVGESLKLMIDHIPNLVAIVTGSASFELLNQIGEPLTGRKNTITLYPLSVAELYKYASGFEFSRALLEYLVYGTYPEIVTTQLVAQKAAKLQDIIGSSLLKDILELDKVKSPKRLVDLLRLLAFQVGSEVSVNELGRQLEMENRTVARYLDLLEKSFIIINLRGYSRNLRKEITKKSKYYFYDNGIRNALINNFNAIEQRDDVGKLWENFLFIERLKFRQYNNVYANMFFWRTWDGQEVDLVEERDGKLFGYEFKWGSKAAKTPKDWLLTYPEATLETINRENFLQFVM